MHETCNMADPDFDRLEAIGDRMTALLDGGGWTREAFEALWKEAREACNGHTEFLEALAIHAEPSWLEDR